MNKPETNLLEQEPKRDLVPMRICAKPYIMSERINRFAKGQTKHKFHHLTFHSEEVATENLWDFAILKKNNLRVETQNTFPKVREGDTPQGKARVSKLSC